MNGYTPRDPATLTVVVIMLGATLWAGFALTRRPPQRRSRRLAWLLTVSATIVVERLCAHEPAGVRMLAIIVVLLYGMKAVVTVQAQLDGMPVLTAWRWLGFATLWPGMRPVVFANVSDKRQPDGWALVRRGCVNASVGLALVWCAWLVGHHLSWALPHDAARVLATVLLLPGLSLILHFGIFHGLAGLWRLAGVDARALFRAPLAARSLENFWGRRWNLAFSEMTSIGVYRPLSRRVGRKGATVVAFLASGLLHELAISVPPQAGFGLPMLYFLLHGVLVLSERALERAGRPISEWGRWAHLWVFAWLGLPLPLLFHLPFLRGVIWPLIGLE